MKKTLILLLSIFFVQYTIAQDTLLKKRPKVGLVLSGGGAKGFAHIGVLKVLEKAGVKIDYIGGTSMGAVVGGLYATGYSATQIDSIFHDTDFDELLQDYIPRASKSFYEKHNQELYALTLPFNKFKIGIPIALSKGMYNYNLLSKLTHSVRHVRDFNKLPIPFLCIATDIEKGEQVLLNSGYLPQAMLASSAFPSLFSPVEINGRLLIDGGVVNNFPIDEIRKLGADIVIGVDVQDDLKDRNTLKDATKILVQITNLDMIRKMNEKKKTTDIYIKPDISNFSVISFELGREIVQKGEDAATAVLPKIRKLITGQSNNNPNSIKVKQDSIFIKGITINDLKNYTRSYVIGKLQFDQGEKISYEDLKKGINTLNATQNFSTISYKLDPLGEEEDFNISLTENPVKTYLKLGLHYDPLYKSAILLNYTQKKNLFKNDILSLDVGIGDNLRYVLDYFRDNGFYWSFGIKSRYNTFNRNLKTDFNQGMLLSQLNLSSINIDYSDFTNQAYVQTVFIQKLLIGGGLEHKFLKINSNNLGTNPNDIERSDYLSVYGYTKFDSFDDKLFPKKGFLFSGDIQSFLYSSNFTNTFNRFSIAKGQFSIVKTIFKKISFKYDSEIGFSIGKKDIHYLDFTLGGYGFNTINNFKQFYGYDYLSISGDSFIKSAFTFDYEFYKKNHVNFCANYANVDNGLFKSGDWFSKPKYNGYALGYAFESIIGPLEIKYTWSPELNSNYTFVSVGFWF